MTTPEQFDPRPRFLMCRPQYFAVTYSINPWMDPAAWSQSGDALHGEALRQWEGLLHAVRRSGATVELVEPENGLPDFVFTANAAVVLDGKALLARFRHPERRHEEAVNAAAFQQMHASGLLEALVRLPDDVVLEGAGDCIWDPTRRLFWIGHGFRSDPRAAHAVEKSFG